jgi:acyl carrier protein
VKKLLNRISNLFDQSPGDSSTAVNSDTAPALAKSPDDGSAPGVEKIIITLQTYIAGKARYKVAPHEIRIHESLWSAGHIDSLSYVEFLVFIEREYGVTVPDVQLSGRLNTLDALATFIFSTMNVFPEKND